MTCPECHGKRTIPGPVAPWWAKGLPINTGGVTLGKRYGK